MLAETDLVIDTGTAVIVDEREGERAP